MPLRQRVASVHVIGDPVLQLRNRPLKHNNVKSVISDGRQRIKRHTDTILHGASLHQNIRDGDSSDDYVLSPLPTYLVRLQELSRSGGRTAQDIMADDHPTCQRLPLGAKVILLWW